MIKVIKNHKIEIELYWNSTLWDKFIQFIEKGLKMWVNKADFQWGTKVIGTWKDLWSDKYINYYQKLYIDWERY